MLLVLIIISMITFSTGLSPAGPVELSDDNTRAIINKYISNISDITDQFVIDERLSKAISHLFKGKLSAFPLYKISLKIDRNPVKIPWTLEEPKKETNTELRDRVNNQFYHPSPEPNQHVQKKYKYGKHITNKYKDIDTKEHNITVEGKDITELAENDTSTNDNDNAKVAKKYVKVNHYQKAKKNLNLSNTANKSPTSTKHVKNPNESEGEAQFVAEPSTIIDISSENSVEIASTIHTDDINNHSDPSTLSTEATTTVIETTDNITETSSLALEFIESGTTDSYQPT